MAKTDLCLTVTLKGGISMKEIKIFIAMVLFYLLLSMPLFAQNQEENNTGINSLEEITLGGVKQWILLRGKSASAPILLYLHGGPGFPGMPFTHIDSPVLEKHFLVVHWDQRGAGKSYNQDIPEETMNIEQFLSDTHDLIQLLRKRFSKNKIFLIGHSWGSVLGIYTAHRHPEYLHAYIGMGQVVNIKEAEMISYLYTIEKAKEAKNENDLKLLEKIGHPSTWEGHQSRFTQRQFLAKYGGSFRKISYMDLGRYWNNSPYYSKTDKNNLMKAMIQTQNIMWDELMQVNFFEEVPEVQIPVYFFTGRYDYQTPFEILERYFKVLKAPYKKIIWFEDSGHAPNLDEPEVYQDKLINIVLDNTLKNRRK